MEDSTPTGPRLLLTEAEAAAALGVSKRFLQKRRYAGDGPVAIRFAHNLLRYRAADLEAWIATKARKSTSDDGTTIGSSTR